MTLSTEEAIWFKDLCDRVVTNIETVLIGKRRVVELALTAMLSQGHLLLEDFPGTGKTSLARAIAQSVQGVSSRIQFTPDLLPGDVTGMSVFEQQTCTFSFHQGPVFTNILLADEINRASPKTQSALLEVMEENRVTVDRISHPVPAPFLVIATQNPIEQAGTYRLPEAQLDRFLIKTTLGYPGHEATITILQQAGTRSHQRELESVVTAEHVLELCELATRVHVVPEILDYIAELIEATRQDPHVRVGSSVRGALGLVRCAKTWAAMNGRTFVSPDDVKDLAEVVLAHRIILDPEAEFEGATAQSVITRVLSQVSPPLDRKTNG